jgi:hypothetical protein
MPFIQLIDFQRLKEFMNDPQVYGTITLIVRGRVNGQAIKIS